MKSIAAADGKILISYQLPEIKDIVSTLGCGDTASAVYSSCLAEGISFDIAFKKALAAASANCLSSTCGNYVPSDANRIEKLICMTESPLLS